jgi:hypothetical protein
MKKIGLGIQDLSKFKEKNLIYVDKTETIYKLITEGDYYFLSRPRRFGKSLLVNTIKELFECNKELFEDTWIYDKWDWEDKYSVIKICFTELDYRTQGLEAALEFYLDKLGRLKNITYESLDYSGKFLELIQKLGKEKPVVILIDEYDKPIIDYLEKETFKKAEENKEILKTFYTGVKEQDRYIRFFMLTGVSKFSRVSIFSDLNHLTDISIVDDYAVLLGYTEEEIKKYYNKYLEKAGARLKLSESALMEKIKEWYNGYSWDGENFVYNPYSVLSFLSAKKFKNYWFKTGTPTFLVKTIKESGKKINESINKMVDENIFDKYDIDNLNITAIMFQTGYLTIKNYDLEKNRYILDFPNKEVRESFLNFAVYNYADSSSEEMEYIVDQLVEGLNRNDMENFFKALQSLFSSITVKQLEKVKEYEGFYHSIIYIVLKIVGIQIDCEIQSSYGVTDAVIKTDDYIYVFEFKMGAAEKALEQIKKKKYYAPFLSDKRTINIVGFGFDKAQRNLAEFIPEKVDNGIRKK